MRSRGEGGEGGVLLWTERWERGLVEGQRNLSLIGSRFSQAIENKGERIWKREEYQKKELIGAISAGGSKRKTWDTGFAPESRKNAQCEMTCSEVVVIHQPGCRQGAVVVVTVGRRGKLKL